MIQQEQIDQLTKERSVIESLVVKQSRHIFSVLPKHIEENFWKDREQITIELILRSFKMIALFYLVFELCSLPLNYISTEEAYRAHDVLMTFIAYSAGWFVLTIVYLIIHKKNWQKYYAIILSIAIGIGLTIIQISIFSAETLSMTWRGSLMIVFCYMFAYLCSGIRPTYIFSSILLSSCMSYVFLITHQKHMIEWVMFNIMILGNIVGLALALFMTSSERIRFLQSLMIEIEQRVNIVLNEHLLKLSQQDTLTLLGNRRSFEKIFAHAYQNAIDQNNSIAILFIDVDYFKFYNDYYGHQQGDVALVQVAQTLMKYVKQEDTAIRYGGEEFVILLTDTSQDDAISIAQDILDDIRAQKIEHSASKVSPYLTVSIGLTLYSGEKQIHQSDLLKVADIALYQSKTNGRNQLTYLAPDLNQLYEQKKSVDIHTLLS